MYVCMHHIHSDACPKQPPLPYAPPPAAEPPDGGAPRREQEPAPSGPPWALRLFLVPGGRGGGAAPGEGRGLMLMTLSDYTVNKTATFGSTSVASAARHLWLPLWLLSLSLTCLRTSRRAVDVVSVSLYAAHTQFCNPPDHHLFALCNRLFD